MPNVWPFGTTDSPLVGGATEEYSANTIRTEMDAGVPNLRRFQSTAPKPYRVNFNKSTADVASFDTFYETTLSDGSDTFEWDDPRTGTTYNWQFIERPTIAPLGNGKWRISCLLERLSAA